MARKSRNRKQRERPRARANGRSRRRLSLWSLLAWLVPLTALVVLVNWIFYQDAVNHYRKHGHVHINYQMLLVSLWATGSAITIAFVWRHERRKAGSGGFKRPTTSDRSGRPS